MKIEDQVCSLELAKRLKKLGMKQESLFYYNRGSLHYKNDFYYGKIQYPAYTVAELVEILPVYSEGYNSLHINKYIHEYEVTYNDSRSETFYKKDTKLSDCLAKTLIHLIENGYVKAEDL